MSSVIMRLGMVKPLLKMSAISYGSKRVPSANLIGFSVLYLGLGVTSVVSFLNLWKVLTPGAPDSGRVPIVTYWRYFPESTHSAWCVVLLLASMAILAIQATAIVLRRDSTNALHSKVLSIVCFNLPVMVDFMVRRFEIMSTVSEDVNCPSWLNWDSFIISMGIIVLIWALVGGSLFRRAT